MTESQFYQRELRPYFTQKGFFHFRVEHARFPDVYLSKANTVLLCEIKCLSKLRDIVSPNWRPGQLAWIIEQSMKGTKNVFLALKVGDSSYFLEPKKFYTKEELKCSTNYLEVLMHRLMG